MKEVDIEEKRRYLNSMGPDYWSMICLCYDFTEIFLREFHDKLDWDMVSSQQILSEDFIREFQDKVDWDSIFYNQELSPAFKKEFQYKLEMISDDCEMRN